MPDTPAALDEHEWYTQLFEYGVEDGLSQGGDDEDEDLVPRLVQQIIAPQVKGFMWGAGAGCECAWRMPRRDCGQLEQLLLI